MPANLINVQKNSDPADTGKMIADGCGSKIPRRMMVGRAVLMILMLVCLFPPAAAGAGGAGKNGKDNLAEIQKRGKIIIATHPQSRPRSRFLESAKRTTDTKCFSNEYTLSQFHGYGIDVARMIAERLGVEPCFVTPAWYEIIGGRWAGRWDMAIASVSITTERMNGLYYARPYVAEPSIFYVHNDNERYRRVEDLSGKKIGTCAGCIFENYLDEDLVLPGNENLSYRIKNADIIAYDPNNLNDLFRELAAGDGVLVDAVLADIFLGSRAIAEGIPVKPLGDPVFYTYIAPAFDKKQSENPVPLIRKINGIIQDLHQDGTLSRIAVQHFDFDTDVISPAGAFDYPSLNQF